MDNFLDADDYFDTDQFSILLDKLSYFNEYDCIYFKCQMNIQKIHKASHIVQNRAVNCYLNDKNDLYLRYYCQHLGEKR